MEPVANLAGRSSSNATAQSRGTFKVFIGFDTNAAQAEALGTAHHVRAQLASDFDIGVTTWDLAYLSAPRLRDRAASEAAAADMIILSCKEDGNSVELLKPWISKWKAQRKKAGALVALIQAEPSEGKTSFFSLLEKTAESAQMDFMAKYCRKKA